MSRPLQVRQSVKSEEARQRREVTERDGNICRFERLKSAGRGQSQWVECGNHATDCAHIIRRHLCAKARFDKDVALKGCRTCHTIFDRRIALTVRVPAARIAAAYAAINAVSKVPLRMPA